MRKLEIGGFGGVNTALDPRLLADNIAQDALNARVENGQLSPRYGYRNLRSTPSGLTGVYCFAYLQGYDDSDETEEYISVETRSGSTRAYAISVDGSTTTEIKDGVASVSLDASEWVATCFDGDIYLMNPNDTNPVYKYPIGDYTGQTAITIPTAPTVAPTYAVAYGPGGDTPYTLFSWAGLDPTSGSELACTGAATNTGSVLNSDNSFQVRHTNSKIDSSFKVDMNLITAGIQDFTNNDGFQITLQCETSSFDISQDSIEPYYINNDSTTLTPNLKSISKLTSGSPGSGSSYVLSFEWSDKLRTDFDNVRYFGVNYRVTSASSTVANNDLIVSKMTVGGIDMSVPIGGQFHDSDEDTGELELAYSYYFSSADFESDLSPSISIANNILNGQLISHGPVALGIHLELTMTVSGDSNVDNFRIYARKKGTEIWYRISTQADSSSTYDVSTGYAELQRGTEFAATPFDSVTTLFGNVSNAFSFKGSLVWLYSGGKSNVRFSAVGNALRQASENDSDQDLSRGSTFTLADNFGDEPLGGIQAGDAVLIAGKYGCYAMFGDYPAQMTPPRKVSSSFGVAGKYAFCRWKDDNGQPGMAYVSRDGQVYFAIAGGFAAQEAGDNIILSGPIRTGGLSLKTYLLDGQSALSLTDFSTAQLVVDEQQDALLVIMGQRGLVLRRPDGQGIRHWEPYQWNTGSSSVTIRYVSGSTKRRVRWMRSDGKMDENEFNSSTSSFIVGSNRDGGNAMPPPYWRTKTHVRQAERAKIVRMYRDTLANAPTITDYSSKTPAGSSIALASGKLEGMLPPAARGTEHSFKIAFSENDDAYHRLEITMENAPDSRGI